jgi:putative transposase
MPENTVLYRRHLPHIHPDGYPIFITFNLANSIPAEIVKQLKAQREQQLLAAVNKDEHYNIQKKHFGKYDKWLDRTEHGPHWLKAEPLAQIVSDEIHNMDTERYDLLAFCIMPNHVHLLIKALRQENPHHMGQTKNYPVADTMRLLKGRTARYCNKLLQRSGKFWHHESYDHYVRDENELSRIMQYIIYNPVKSGLTNEWKDWKFSYANPALGEW